MVQPSSERPPARVDALGIAPPPAYSLEDVTGAAGPTVLVVRGEVDIAAAGPLRAHADAATAPGLVLDVAEVTFVDSSALRELLRARHALAERDAGLVLAGMPPTLRRLLEMTGTAGLFETARGRDEAIARLRDAA
jgi:anti-sigma B factor antagonist